MAGRRRWRQARRRPDAAYEGGGRRPRRGRGGGAAELGRRSREAEAEAEGGAAETVTLPKDPMAMGAVVLAVEVSHSVGASPVVGLIAIGAMAMAENGEGSA